MKTMKQRKVMTGAVALATLMFAGALALVAEAAPAPEEGGQAPSVTTQNSTAQTLVSPDEKTVLDYDHVSVEHPLKVNASNADGCHYVLSLIPLHQERIADFLSLAGRVESSTCPINGSTQGIVIGDAVRNKAGELAVDTTLSVFAVH